MRSTTLSWKAFLAKVLVAVMIILSVAVVPTTTKAANEPTLNKSSRNIFIGSTYNLNVTNKVNGSTYAWSSSDSNIATVNQSGIVKGKKAGQAVITCIVTAPDATYNLNCTVTVIQRALVFNINNKVSTLNVGQAYDLNRTLRPSTSNDKTKWTSSDSSIAAPGKNGKFTALKTGTVTITGTTLSGKSDTVTIKVVDANGTVATEEGLKALLGSGVQKITLKTSAKVDVTIPAGTYSGTTLVVDAPNADVHNNGVFAKIDILNIAQNSWYEGAIGNLLNILTDASRVVVEPGAKVKIEVSAEGAKLVIVNNGYVEEFIVDKPADVDMSGDSKQPVTATINIPGVTITSSVPLNLNCEAKVDLVLLPGAESSVITADKDENVPEVTGDVVVKVAVGTGEQKKVATVTGTPLNLNIIITPAAGYIPPSTPVPEIVKTNNGDGSVTFKMSNSYADLKAINVSYKGQNYSIDGDTLTVLKSFLGKEAVSLLVWKMTTDTTRTYSGQSFTVKGDEGSLTKTVKFTGGSLDGKSYEATVDYSKSAVTVTSKQSGVSFTISIVDSYTLKISSSVPTLIFDPTF